MKINALILLAILASSLMACRKTELKRPDPAPANPAPVLNIVSIDDTTNLKMEYVSWKEDGMPPYEPPEYLVYLVSMSGYIKDSNDVDWDIYMYTIVTTDTLNQPLGKFNTYLTLTQHDSIDNVVALKDFSVNFVELYQLSIPVDFNGNFLISTGLGKYRSLKNPNGLFTCSGRTDPVNKTVQFKLKGKLVT